MSVVEKKEGGWKEGRVNVVKNAKEMRHGMNLYQVKMEGAA